MNIFYIHKNPKIAAKMMTDKHVVKMIVESAQLLSTAHRIIDGTETTRVSKNGRRLKYWELSDIKLNEVLYVPTHFNHPSAIWTRSSKKNYKWLYKHFIELGLEFEIRFKKKHLTILKLKDYLKVIPKKIKSNKFTPPALAVPELYLDDKKSHLEIYRDYYKSEKLKDKVDVKRFYKYI